MNLPPDAARLRQALDSLRGCAVKCSEYGSVTLRLNIKPADSSEDMRVTVEVEDTGIHIAPEDQARTFDAFVQLGRAVRQNCTDPRVAIARQFIQEMGGKIQVENTLDNGSRFRVEMPVQRAKTSKQDEEHILGLKPTMEPWLEELAALPAELRAELREALIELEAERIAGTIESVAKRDAALGEALGHRADQLAYTAMLNAVETCTNWSPTLFPQV
jgi:hypothetical protein